MTIERLQSPEEFFVGVKEERLAQRAPPAGLLAGTFLLQCREAPLGGCPLGPLFLHRRVEGRGVEEPLRLVHGPLRELRAQRDFTHLHELQGPLQRLLRGSHVLEQVRRRLLDAAKVEELFELPVDVLGRRHTLPEPLAEAIGVVKRPVGSRDRREKRLVGPSDGPGFGDLQLAGGDILRNIEKQHEPLVEHEVF